MNGHELPPVVTGGACHTRWALRREDRGRCLKTASSARAVWSGPEGAADGGTSPASRGRHRAQSGLSRATVDRVLHGREGVRPETVAQVDQAIAELERQRGQVQLSARTLILDLVMQSPDRFASASRDALETELRALRPAVVRARSQLSEHSDPAAAVAVLDDIAHRGSDGVILKAPDTPEVAAAVDRLARGGHPHGHVRHRRRARAARRRTSGSTTVQPGPRRRT